MADNLTKKPPKGILKTSTSFETTENQKPSSNRYKETKWDEMNILATLHPADKDYGHMRIEEPKTPYNWAEGDVEPCSFEAEALTEKLLLEAKKPPRVLAEDPADSDEEFDDLPPEIIAKKKVFESKRKIHYNEFQAVKLARKLMEEDEHEEANGDDDDDDDEDLMEDRTELAELEAQAECSTTHLHRLLYQKIAVNEERRLLKRAKMLQQAAKKGKK